MNDTTSAEFSPPRNAMAGGHPWDGKSKAAEEAPGPAPAEPLAVFGDAVNGYG
ncbi:hypothetical protein [Streptomyces sp. NPDC059649]|uniref:hypothetical protein n=1 Tax=Streptomyces sp. NPDC059649 TaxID=3346895 RepID=UPI0036783FD1